MSLPGSGGRPAVESILHKKKKWLREKVEEIRTSYSDTLGAIRDKLDSFVNEPINMANSLLDKPDNALSLLEIATVGNMLQESNKYLFDVLLAACSSGNDRNGGNQGDTVGLQLVPVSNHPVVAQQRETQIVAVASSQQLGLDYMHLEAASVASGLAPRASLRYNSESEAGAFETLPLPAIDMNSGSEDGCLMESTPFKGLPTMPVSPNIVQSCNGTSVHSSSSDRTRSIPQHHEYHCDDESFVKIHKNNMATEQASTMSGTTSLKELYTSYSSVESDTNGFHALVSDVVSPYSFSIQPEESMLAIKTLQKELNQFYGEESGRLAELELRNIPCPGDCCAVIFQPDSRWYRACVISLTSQTTMLVEYIDYGNVDEVPWRSAYKLHSTFTHLPQQAMHCSLAYVKPVKTRCDAGDGQVEWDKRSIEWFDKFTYGKMYQVIPVDNDVGPIRVKLLYFEELEGGAHEVKGVADMLVQSGNAVFVTQSNESNAPTLKVCQGDLEKLAIMGRGEAQPGTGTTEVLKREGSEKHQQKSLQRGGESSSVVWPSLEQASMVKSGCMGDGREIVTDQSVSCIPAGMEQSYDMFSPHQRSRAPTPDVCGPQGAGIVVSENSLSNHHNQASLQLEELVPCASDSARTKEFDNERMKNEEKRLLEWNPMSEDYNSLRNSYGVDDENACVVTEGYDPEKIPICRHYIRGRCWNGDRCPNIHPKQNENGEMRSQVPTFSASSLSSLTISEDSWSIVRLSTVNSTGSFYVQVIKTVADMQDCIKFVKLPSRLDSSVDLMNLMADMQKHYCSYGSTRRLKDLIKPALGEMYAVNVPEEKCFYRGMIKEVFISSTPTTTVKVHLVDFGKDVVALERYLHPMTQAFMHLPKQAVMCSLWDGKLSDYPKLAQLASSPGVTHLAMKVRSRSERTDGPIQVTLYNVDQDGVHPFPPT